MNGKGFYSGGLDQKLPQKKLYEPSMVLETTASPQKCSQPNPTPLISPLRVSGLSEDGICPDIKPILATCLKKGAKICNKTKRKKKKQKHMYVCM